MSITVEDVETLQVLSQVADLERRHAEGWRNAQSLLDRSSIFDLFELKTYLEDNLKVC